MGQSSRTPRHANTHTLRNKRPSPDMTIQLSTAGVAQCTNVREETADLLRDSCVGTNRIIRIAHVHVAGDSRIVRELVSRLISSFTSGWNGARMRHGAVYWLGADR